MFHRLFAIVLLGIFSASILAAEPQSAEPRLINAIDKVSNQRIDDALLEVRSLLDKTPQFHLAQLVYADLLMAKAGMPGQLGLRPDAMRGGKIDDLRTEARVRWQRYKEKPAPGLLPDVLLQLSPKQKTAIVTDLSRSRLYLFENNGKGLRLVSDFYVTQGKNGKDKQIEGDSKTPLGTYFVTASLDTNKLPDLYGSGAFPIDYPNAWDRQQGKTGHGIWLHGVPSDTYNRAPLATKGCLAMSNIELDSLKPFLQTGVTPVIISSRLNWVTADKLRDEVTAVNSNIEKWLDDWRSRDVDAYLKHYSKSFHSDNKNYDLWAQHKKRVTQYKKFIEVELSDLSILRYPDEADMVVVSYRQDYRSTNYNGVSSKRQYWQKEADGQWRIVYEGRG